MSASRKSSKRSKKPASPGSWIGLVALSGLAVWLLWRPQTPAPAKLPPLPDSEVASGEPTAARSVEALSEQDYQNRIQRQQKAVKQAKLMRAMGFRPLAQQKDGFWHFQALLQTRASRCHKGDFDIMKQEQELSQQELSFFLSLESIEDKRLIDRQRFRLDELQSGLRLDLKVPASEEPQHLALFVCSTTGGRSPCLRQQAMDVTAIEKEQIQAISTNSDYPARGRIFAFHFLTSQNERLFAFSSPSRLSSYFDELDRAFRSLHGTAYKANLASQLRRWVQATGSLAPVVRPERISMELPQMNPDCFRGQR